MRLCDDHHQVRQEMCSRISQCANVPINSNDINIQFRTVRNAFPANRSDSVQVVVISARQDLVEQISPAILDSTNYDVTNTDYPATHDAATSDNAEKVN